ncbi:zinc-binding dehydrogenase [Massilia sp. CCM 8734]|uniref:zinc-binding dehydrogenase n=1 Tax=Massilia sp. CCM 8734 TaxID=2609283 RepID=UPI001E5D72A3|nr:zinc-binding dehydrogenase [Massilia sp. CCM 8734]
MARTLPGGGLCEWRDSQAAAEPDLAQGRLADGVFWGEFAKREPKASLAAMRELMGWLAEGKIRPRISARYTLEQSAQALNDMAARKVTGKVVILPQA